MVLGIDAVRAPEGGAPGDGSPILVAGYSDELKAKGRPVALVEHGAGQDYGTGNPANPGGRGRERVGLFLCPNRSVAARNAAVYPDAAVEVVGCPKLDAYFRPWTTRRVGLGAPLVVFTWHHEGQTGAAPEARSAWPHYRPSFREIVAALTDRGFEVAGHAHPRKASEMRRAYDAVGVRWIPTLAEVLDTASVLVADNTSAMYEAAAVGVDVVVLNAPWYRRDVEHGLRFWGEHRLGPVCDWPGEVPGAVVAAYERVYDTAETARIVDLVYGPLDGHAATRAAVALEEWLRSGPEGVRVAQRRRGRG
jgi:hypothetical protein